MSKLLEEIRGCTICAESLPLGPKPVLSYRPNSKILIIGQAPGTKVHETGIPWNDESGKRLREWLGVDQEQFHNPDLFAIVPMGFCYPGKGKSGDLPPRPECAPQWHQKIISELTEIKLTLLIGQYAQKHYLKTWDWMSLTETVKHYDEYLPYFFPLPHPSPRNRAWLKNNPWFEEDVVPSLQSRIRKIIK